MTDAWHDDPGFDARELRVVKAIADEGSITGAALALGYSQPAVSQQLKRLEQRLGVAIVERVGRSVRLTDAGRILARHAPAVTTALDAAAGELAELRGLRSARVRLVGFPSASPTIVPRLLADLAQRHPGISLTYVEAEPPEAVEAVREDRTDIALTFSYPGDRDDPHGSSARGLTVHTVGSDELLAVLPAEHQAATAEVLDVATLADDDWIAGCPRCRGHLLELCGRAGFAPRIAFETDNFVAVEGLVAQGIGVATLPRMAVESFPQLPGVAVVPLPAGEQRRIHTVTARGADRVPAVRATLDALARLVSAPADEPGAPPARN
ncbi:LysR family transcriptional regulator [Microbacterium trichothecenolyticum]|uniref:LysR family transcriptional regulator n=1 Tax=Microbacterium trichothecenolyticum TaxID=69370 RepID=UPI001C6E126F|nr:LysR family transcriptional regulator [Microbacterium trichothecenolyticum]MBW9118630.1 LysR family transcriptional regulator [Microbacterium trichothecenolyticum]